MLSSALQVPANIVPDISSVIVEIHKIAEAKKSRGPLPRLNTKLLRECDQFLDRVTGIRRRFVSEPYEPLRTFFREVLQEAGIDIDDDNHLYNVIRRLRGVLRRLGDVNDDAREKAGRFYIALHRRLPQLVRT